MLVVVSAPSGAGKTSLCEWVVTAVPNLAHSVSFTTRPPRRDERGRRDYIFFDSPFNDGADLLGQRHRPW